MGITVATPGHKYFVTYDDKGNKQEIKFQDGPIKEVGVNGVQNLDLIDILMDRMNYLQTMNEGKYACIDNEYMILHLRAFKELDEARTRARQKRNVEGTNEA